MTNEMFVVDGTGSATEVVDGSTVIGPHGEGCNCDSMMADMAAMAVTIATTDFAADNADRINAAGLDLRNLIANEQVTPDGLTEHEKLFIEAITLGFKYGKEFGEVMSAPPPPSLFDFAGSLDDFLAMLGEIGEDELPSLVE